MLDGQSARDESVRDLIALLIKMKISNGSAWRTEAEIARGLLCLADRHDVAVEPVIRQNLEKEIQLLNR